MKTRHFQQRRTPVLRPEMRDAATVSGRMRSLLAGVAVLALAACDGETLDWDLRRPGAGLDTTSAAQQVAARRPRPDARGVIAFPTYEMAEARRGDTVASLAARVGLPADEVARYNGLAPDTTLRAGEVIALPRRAGTPATAPGGSGIDISTLAGTAIDRAEAGRPRAPATQPQASQAAGAGGPVRHQVVRGETAYSIARLYNVTPRSLAEWNGLGPDLSVREGQFLVIPEGRAGTAPADATETTAPGQGSPTPVPPSAAQPLPRETPPPASAPATAEPSADLGASRTEATLMAMPADGPIIRPFSRGSNDGIDIGAGAGSPVRAAADGTVAAITTDTNGITYIVLRHADGLLTAYGDVNNVAVANGDRVSRGQVIAAVRGEAENYLNFAVFRGSDSIDPMPFLQ